MENWIKGGEYDYPEDFGDILNDVKIYRCENSGKRIITSNGIPDHFVKQGNNNSPCEQFWAISVRDSCKCPIMPNGISYQSNT